MNQPGSSLDWTYNRKLDKRRVFKEVAASFAIARAIESESTFRSRKCGGSFEVEILACALPSLSALFFSESPQKSLWRMHYL